MLERQLRRHRRILLRELDIRPPFDLTELGTRLAGRRGKQIHLAAVPFPVPGALPARPSHSGSLIQVQWTNDIHGCNVSLT